MFWGFHQRLHLQCWLALWAEKGPQNSQSWYLTRLKIRIWVNTEFVRDWDEKWVLTQNIGSLGALRVRKHLPAPAFWAPWTWFSLSQRWRRNLWGKPQNISERSGWCGGVICRYFSSRNSWEHLFFLKIEIFTIYLLFPLFLDDPVSFRIWHWATIEHEMKGMAQGWGITKSQKDPLSERSNQFKQKSRNEAR